ncbi:MAG: polysaccharide deacetylase family protein [Defluviitaleaceae bacterium]|nr:polysaccharide deacetylase family protein [Defluviitaleaceae bacterium]
MTRYLVQAALAFATAISVLITAPVMIEKKVAATVFSGGAGITEAGKTKKLPIYSVDTPEKQVAITFDAAWGADDTDILLEILARNDVLATFFFCGSWVDKFPEDVQKFATAGHDIANHGDTHAHVSKLNLEQNKQEIKGCHDKIKAVTGIEMNLYRPAYGEYNNDVLNAAEELNYYTIQWDVDSHDWMARGAEYEIDRVLNHKDLQNGSIILFHNDAKFTPQTLDTVIKGLKEKGYDLVPVSQLIYTENFKIDHAGRQKSMK